MTRGDIYCLTGVCILGGSLYLLHPVACGMFSGGVVLAFGIWQQINSRKKPR
jgi:hypothetical protein